MNIAILSPCLFYTNDMDNFEKKQTHALKLGELINYLRKHFDLEIEEYRKAPYSGYCMNIPKYNNYALDNYIMTNVFSVIQKMIKKDKYIDLESVEPVKCITPMMLEDDNFTEAFFSYLNHSRNLEKKVLFIGEQNQVNNSPFHFRYEENFEIAASKEFFIELTPVLTDFLKNEFEWDSIFPRKDACQKYNKYVLAEKKKGLEESEKIALYDKVGKIVALYNGYIRDDRLCKINSSSIKKRTVFKKQKGKVFYLSIDIESGGFEVFDSAYRHLGQFDFSGNKVKDSESLNHKLFHR